MWLEFKGNDKAGMKAEDKKKNESQFMRNMYVLLGLNINTKNNKNPLKDFRQYLALSRYIFLKSHFGRKILIQNSLKIYKTLKKKP